MEAVMAPLIASNLDLFELPTALCCPFLVASSLCLSLSKF